MSDETLPSDPPPPNRTRRSSFAGQTFADLFGTGRSGMSNRESNNSAAGATAASPSTNQQFPGPITTAAAQAQQRRMSLTTLGLSGANGQASSFSGFRGRTESFGSANSGSYDESAIAEDDGERSAGAIPITRRTSFGARALRDIRRGSTTGVPTTGSGGNSPGQQNGTSSPSPNMRSQAPATGTISSRDTKGRGFNWSENFRTRAERTSSISGQGGGGSPTSARMPPHSRSQSVAVMEPAALEPPVNSIPKARDYGRPDHFQERILKGDFYMD